MTIGTNDWTGVTLAGGRYRIVAKLGEGGMGSVYRAEDRNLDADVVIKVPHPAMLADPEFAGRFTREIRSLVKLSHPRIVKVTDVGARDGLPFAVLQYLPGGSLEDRQHSARAGCDPKELARWLPGIAEALDYVHAQGYVHRDVKPGNILFDAQGHPFLGDFGVVKALASSAEAKAAEPARTAMTGAGMVLGTPEYMAPELIMGDPCDGRVDQYALAITVYELLCGRRPFEDETKTKVLVLHTTRPPQPPDAFCPTIPVRLSQAVLKGLAKEPLGRYPSCVALAGAVLAAVGAGANPERLRIRCPSCGKSLAMDAANFARMKQAGRPLPCPACQSPIQIGAALVANPPDSVATRGGTAILSTPGSTSGETPVVRDVPSPPIAAGKTVALSSQGEYAVAGPAPPPLATTRRAETVLERVRPPRVEPKKKQGAVVAWIAVGTMVVLSGIVWAVGGAFTNRPEPKPVRSPAPPQPVRQVAAVPTPVPRPAPPPREEIAARPIDAPPPPANPPLDSATVPMPPFDLNRNAADRPDLAALSRPPGMAPGTSPFAPKSTPTPADAPAEAPPPVADKTPVDLIKLVAAPEPQRNRALVASGLYCFGSGVNYRPEGSVGVSVIKSDLHYNFKTDSTTVRRAESVDLDIDPGLAEQLARAGLLRPRYAPVAAGAGWDGNVALLTVWVTNRTKAADELCCRIVTAEVFTDFDLSVVPPNSTKKRLKVAYKTRTFTPAGATSGMGDDDDWKQMDRLWHITNQFQQDFRARYNQQSLAKWTRFQMSVNQTVSRGAAAAALESNAIHAREMQKVGGGR